MNQYEPSGDAMLCYDLGRFHSGPACKVELNYPYVYCTACRVVAHVDLVGTHITPSSARIPRKEG